MSKYLCGLPTCTVNQNRGKHGIIKSIQKYFPISLNSNNTQALKQKRSLKYIHKNKQKISQTPRPNKRAQHKNMQQVDKKMRLVHKNDNLSLLTEKIAQIKDCQLDKNRRKYQNTYYNGQKNNISSLNINNIKQPNLTNFQSKRQFQVKPALQRVQGRQNVVINNRFSLDEYKQISNFHQNSSFFTNNSISTIQFQNNQNNRFSQLNLPTNTKREIIHYKNDLKPQYIQFQNFNNREIAKNNNNYQRQNINQTNYKKSKHQGGFFKGQTINLNKLSNKTKQIDRFYKPQIQQVKSQKYIETNFITVINQLPVSPRFIQARINQFSISFNQNNLKKCEEKLTSLQFQKNNIIGANQNNERQQRIQLQKTRTTMFSSKMSQQNPNILAKQTKKANFCALKQNNRTTFVYKGQQDKKQNKIQLVKNQSEYQNPFRQILDNKNNFQKIENKSPLLLNQKATNLQIKQINKISNNYSINNIKDAILNQPQQLPTPQFQYLKQSKLKSKQNTIQDAINIKATDSIIQDQNTQQVNTSFVDKIKQSKVRFCNQKTNINSLYINFKSQKLNGQQYRINQFKTKRKNSFFFPLETGSTSTSCMTTKKPSHWKQKDLVWQNSQQQLKGEDNQFQAQLSNFQIKDAQSLVDSDQKSSQTSELEYVVHSSNKLQIKKLGINDYLQYQEYQNENQV